MCRLFLYCACHNYDAYDAPELPEDISDGHKELINSLLNIDRDKRLTPKEFYTKMMKRSPSNSSDELKDLPGDNINNNWSSGILSSKLESASTGHIIAH